MSSSLKFCVLAAGEADIYAANARASEWDIAAGHAILEHAGGTITNHNNEKFLYGKSNYKNPAIIGEDALSTKREKDITPRVVAATPSPTTSSAAAVRIGWSLNKNVPNKARIAIRAHPCP